MHCKCNLSDLKTRKIYHVPSVHAQAQTHIRFHFYSAQILHCTRHTSSLTQISCKLQRFSNKSELHLLKGWLSEILTNSSTNQNPCMGHTIRKHVVFTWMCLCSRCADNVLTGPVRHHRCGWCMLWKIA